MTDWPMITQVEGGPAWVLIAWAGPWAAHTVVPGCDGCAWRSDLRRSRAGARARGQGLGAQGLACPRLAQGLAELHPW